MNIPAALATAMVRPADTDVSDLTGATRAGDPFWQADGSLEVPFDPEPSSPQQQLIRRRLLTKDAREERIVTALADVYSKLDPAKPLEQAARLLIEDRIAHVEGW